MSIVKEGYPFILIPFILGLACIYGGTKIGFVFYIIGVVLLLAAAFCVYFFRDPKIAITQGKDLILSPCNGTVLEVSENDKEKVIRVFLSVLDVHLQRSPVAGKVTKVEYKPGKFLKAMEPDAHIVNEQNIITIENDNGVYLVKQIAGILARRCVSWVKPGDVLQAGDKIGVIKFSSQVDLHMPKNIAVSVKKNDKVVSGITVLGKIK